MSPPPHLVVTLTCDGDRRFAYDRVYAVIDGVDESVTYVDTVFLDHYGDQHKWLSTEARLFQIDGSFVINFEEGDLAPAPWWRRNDGKWTAVSDLAEQHRLRNANLHAIAPSLPLRGCGQHNDGPFRLEEEMGNLVVRCTSGPLLSVPVTGAGRRAAGMQAPVARLWVIPTCAFVIVAEDSEAGRQASHDVFAWPLEGRAFTRVVDAEERATLERASRAARAALPALALTSAHDATNHRATC